MSSLIKPCSNNFNINTKTYNKHLHIYKKYSTYSNDLTDLFQKRKSKKYKQTEQNERKIYNTTEKTTRNTGNKEKLQNTLTLTSLKTAAEVVVLVMKLGLLLPFPETNFPVSSFIVQGIRSPVNAIMYIIRMWTPNPIPVPGPPPGFLLQL